jgi:alkanesulfonate monooxygenase
MAARMFATLDRVSSGRAGVHIITGSNDIEMRADGDYLTKEERYARSREYVEVMKRMWSEQEPFDHSGPYYRFEGAFAAVKPISPGSIPVFWGGGSPAAIENGSAVADIFALAGAAYEHIARAVEAVRQAAPARAKTMEFLISSRVILAYTEAAAWDTAHSHLRALVTELAERGDLERNEGESMEAAIDRKIQAVTVDSRNGCVFTAFGKVGIGRPIANCLVGTPDQIVGFLEDFARLGVTRFILAGYDPRTYPAQFGDVLLPRLRQRLEPIVNAS